MFALPDSWVWDFWVADDGERYHLFFLFASRALGDPDLRHVRAGIGHAVSDDLVVWRRIEDALVHGDAADFDGIATWTGCTVRHPDGSWLLFYTGLTRRDGRYVQSIGVATSDDLVTWRKQGRVLSADPRWYETAADGPDESFRDPWVFREGDRWRMLITAKAAAGPDGDRGVIGTAVSDDLRTWTLQPPLSAPGSGFDQLEVMETTVVDGVPILLFNCLAPELGPARRASGSTGGVWVMPWRGGDVPADPREADLLAGHDLYVGRVVRDRAAGRPVFLAFRNRDADGRFPGTLTDPVPIGVVDGAVRLLASP